MIPPTLAPTEGLRGTRADGRTREPEAGIRFLVVVLQSEGRREEGREGKESHRCSFSLAKRSPLYSSIAAPLLPRPSPPLPLTCCCSPRASSPDLQLVTPVPLVRVRGSSRMTSPSSLSSFTRSPSSLACMTQSASRHLAPRHMCAHGTREAYLLCVKSTRVPSMRECARVCLSFYR